MKIALIAPVEESVPPKKYGGTERVVYEIAHGIGKLGHEVDLYASGDSKKEPYYHLYPLVAKHLRATSEYKQDQKLRDTEKLVLLSHVIEKVRKKKYDLIHNNMGWRYLIFHHFIEAPVLTTHHGTLNLPYQQLVYGMHKDAYHVSISDNQRKDMPQLNYLATVYNGVDTNEMAFQDNPTTEHMLFLARLSPEKGPVMAVEAAIRTKKKLLIATKIDIADEIFYDTVFKQYIPNPYVSMEGEIGNTRKVHTIQNSKALLVPIQWEEPFGLMFTESMSCGTPVITFARGSAPELIEDGVTGFLVNESEELKRGNFIVKKTGLAGLCEAIERLYAMEHEAYTAMRYACRARVEKYFTIAQMIKGYEDVYRMIVDQEKKKKK